MARMHFIGDMKYLLVPGDKLVKLLPEAKDNESLQDRIDSLKTPRKGQHVISVGHLALAQPLLT